VTVSILFRTPTSQGFAVEGFTDAEGNLARDIVATYDKGASDKANKRYVYHCEGEAVPGGKRTVTLDKHHATWGAAKALFTALGVNPDAEADESPSERIARLKAELAAAEAAAAPKATRGRRTARK